MRKIAIDKQTIVFIVLVVVLSLELFALLPLSVKRIVTLSKEISTLRTNLNNIKREWPRKDDYEVRKQELSQALAALRGKLVSVDDESKLLSFISEEVLITRFEFGLMQVLLQNAHKFRPIKSCLGFLLCLCAIISSPICFQP